MSMFRELLPPMRMGGPEHVHRHTSFVFYELGKPDNDALDAQDERDYRLNTMTPQQTRDRQTRTNRNNPPTSPAHPASAKPDQIDLTGGPDASPTTFGSIELAPDFAKGHFRLALALQAEQKFEEACVAFNRTLKLEPKNKDAQQGLRMAEVQGERLRRQQAAA